MLDLGGRVENCKKRASLLQAKKFYSVGPLYFSPPITFVALKLLPWRPNYFQSGISPNNTFSLTQNLTSWPFQPCPFAGRH